MGDYMHTKIFNANPIKKGRSKRPLKIQFELGFSNIFLVFVSAC